MGEFETLCECKDEYQERLTDFIEHQGYFWGHDKFMDYYKEINLSSDRLMDQIKASIPSRGWLDDKAYSLAYLMILCDNTWDSLCRKPHDGGGYEFHSVNWCVCLARKIRDLLEVQDLPSASFKIINPDFPINTVMNLYADWLMIENEEAIKDIEKYFNGPGQTMYRMKLMDKEFLFKSHMPNSFTRAYGISAYIGIDSLVQRRKYIWDLKDFG